MTREQWAKLTPEEQRIKVAECRHRAHVLSLKQSGYVEADRVWQEDANDYPNDLNAMHKAEMTMPRTKKNIRLWHHWIATICKTTWGMRCATATQRAEAFVLTMTEGRG